MSKHTKVVFLTAALLFLGACGGGGGGQVAGTGGMGGTGVQVVSNGVMTKGSVVVNGVRYADTTASISIDDTPKTATNLQNGMVVSVQGSIDASGRNGTAQQVNAIIEVRGLVTSKDAVMIPQRFVVFGQTVIVDDLTVYSDITFNAITEGTSIVEVHGLRDSLGNIRATRVEANLGPAPLPNGSVMANPLVDEIRGVVSLSATPGANPTTFNLGTQVVDFVGLPADIIGGSYQNGSIVEVHCTQRPDCLVAGVFQASRIEVEDASNLPGTGQRFEVEGLISGFAAGRHPGTFLVAGISVTTTASTRFEGGIAGDLLDNIKVEAEGTWNGTTLTASKIEFKRSVIRLQGFVTAQTPSTFTLDIAERSVEVEIDSFTDADAALPANGSNTCVQVRGQRKAGAQVVIAGEIRVDGCSGGGDHLIQAPVEVENETGFTLTLLGFEIDVSSPTDTTNPGDTGYENIDDLPMARAEFFSAVVAADPLAVPPVAGTLVKIRFDAAPATTVKQVELED